jgi:hypothetical protein
MKVRNDIEMDLEDVSSGRIKPLTEMSTGRYIFWYSSNRNEYQKM